MVTFLKPRSDWVFLFVTCVCVTIRLAHGATQAEERSSEKVKIKMYDLSTSDWTTSKRNTFSTVIAAEANTYCGNSLSSCGLDSAATFSSAEVGTSSADKDGSSIEFTFYIDYPSGASVTAGGDTAHVLPKSAAQAIAAAARGEIKDEVGYYVTYIDEEYYSIPPNTDTNRVIIPIAFVVVILLAVAVVALHYHQKHKERQDLITKRLARKKQQQQQLGTTSPSYSALDTTTTTILTNHNTTPRRGYGNGNTTTTNNNNNNHFQTGQTNKFSTRDQYSPNKFVDDEGPVVVSLSKTKPPPHQQQQQQQSPSRMSRPMTSHSVNDFHDGQYVLGQPLEPKTKSVVENLEDDEAKRERRRKKKEKRRERKRREEEGGGGGGGGERVMETSYENPVFNSSNLSEGSYSYQY